MSKDDIIVLGAQKAHLQELKDLKDAKEKESCGDCIYIGDDKVCEECYAQHRYTSPDDYPRV